MFDVGRVGRGSSQSVATKNCGVTISALVPQPQHRYALVSGHTCKPMADRVATCGDGLRTTSTCCSALSTTGKGATVNVEGPAQHPRDIVVPSN